jgi:hypothetical protein
MCHVIDAFQMRSKFVFNLASNFIAHPLEDINIINPNDMG